MSRCRRLALEKKLKIQFEKPILTAEEFLIFEPPPPLAVVFV
jgi:hypothetical protein